MRQVVGGNWEQTSYRYVYCIHTQWHGYPFHRGMVIISKCPSVYRDCGTRAIALAIMLGIFVTSYARENQGLFKVVDRLLS
jgi:hypothetical protein